MSGEVLFADKGRTQANGKGTGELAAAVEGDQFGRSAGLGNDMRWLDKLRLRLRSIFRKRQVERELELEMQFHIERQVQENLYSGMSAADARYMALRLIDRIE